MVSMGGPSKSKSLQAPVFKYLPGQEAYLPEYTSIWKDIFTGNMASPTARALQTITGEAGMREAATQRRSIAETRGMSTPARQRAVAGAGETAVKTMAGVPQEMWSKAAEYLSQFTLQQPAVGQVGKSSSEGGGSFGVCCFIFLATDPTDELLLVVRRYKDSHFNKESTVARGYKRLALWFVPPMRRYNIVKQLVKYVMVHPMELYAKAYYDSKTFQEIVLFPIAHFWVSIYWIIGKFYGEKQWIRYLRLKEVF